MIDAYKIGVSIAFASNGEAILGGLLRHLVGIHNAADIAKSKMEGMRGAAFAAIGAVGGFAGINAIWGVIKDARDLNDQLERTKQLGGDFARTVDATRLAAYNTANTVGITNVTDNVRLAREIGVTLGNPQAAIDMLPVAAKDAFVVSHFTGESQEDIIKNLTRGADARGQIFSRGADGQEHVDPAKLTAEFEAMSKGLILGGGFLKSGDLLQMVRQAGPAAKTQTPEAFYAAGVELAVAMGAPKTGTAEMGLFQQFIGGTMTKKVAEHLTTAGFLRPGDWHSGRSGGVVVEPGVAARFTGMTNDPAAYFSTGEGAARIAAFAQKEGIPAIAAVFQLFGRQTVERLVSDMYTNRPQIERARGIFNAIPSVSGQYNELVNDDLDTNVVMFSNAWSTLMKALGEAGIPSAIGVMHELTDGLHFMTAELVAHPWGKALIYTAAGLSALLAAGGSITVISFALGSTGLASGIGALASKAGLFTAGGEGAVGIAGATTGIGSLTAALGPFGLAALATAGLVAAAYYLLPSTADLMKKLQADDDAHPGQQRTGGGARGGWRNIPSIAPDAHANLPALRGRYGQQGTPSNPLHVTVTNTGDIARGANAYTTGQLARPDPGPTGGDPRDSNPFGSFGAGP